MKKKYIRPTMKKVALMQAHILLTESSYKQEVTPQGSSVLSRDNGIFWDDEEEEIEDSMWK